jgi:hypothetical protein
MYVVTVESIVRPEHAGEFRRADHGWQGEAGR